MSAATGSMKLTKHHGLGNDFLVALERVNPGLVPSASIARQLCSRHRGIGADGMMFAMEPAAAGADIDMVLFNADGSRAEISGNGIRCLAQAVLRDGGNRAGAVTVDGTVDGESRRRVVTSVATSDPAADLLSVSMGRVVDGPVMSAVATQAAALYSPRHVGTGDIGNPHLVLELDTVDRIEAATDGPRLESEFAGGINVHFMEPTGPDRIKLVHWERGAGVTDACGSGATVSASLAHQWGLVGTTVTVDMPGGSVRVDIGDGDEMQLTGEAVFIASIEVPAAIEVPHV